jgi:hypothetical protein
LSIWEKETECAMTDRKTVACGCDLTRRQPGERLTIQLTGEAFLAVRDRPGSPLRWVSYANTQHSTEELVEMIHMTDGRFKLD